MATNAPDSSGALVTVFDTEQENEALVVQGLLDSAGIESVMTTLDVPQDVIPVGGVVLQVRAEQADEARRVIAESQTNSGETDSDSSANDNSKEPAV
jgi:hypothetical protein